MHPRVLPCCFAVVLGACATGPGAGATLDPELVQLAQSSQTIGGIKVRTDENGAVIKMSVYHADESAIPAWARAKATEKWPDSKLRSYETEWYADDGRVYEIEVTTKEGKSCEISIAKSGTERYTECEIDPNAVPDPVAATLAKAIPGGKVEEAETHQGPDVDEVSLEVEDPGGRVHYVRIGSDGKLLQHLIRVPTILEVPAP